MAILHCPTCKTALEPTDDGRAFCPECWAVGKVGANRCRFPRKPTPRCRWCAGPMEVFEGEPYCPACVSYGIVLTVDAIEQTLARTLARQLAEEQGDDAIIEQAYAEALEEEAKEAPEE